MLNIERALQSPRALQALAGVSRTGFEELESRLAAVVSEQDPASISAGTGRWAQTHLTDSAREALFYPVISQVLSDVRCGRPVV